MKKTFHNRRTFDDVKGLTNLRHLGHILDFTPEQLLHYAEHAAEYYHPTEMLIKEKLRSVDRPVGELKAVQDLIRERILSLYPLCDIAYGAVPGKSPKDNAAQHVKKPVVVRIDLKNCFHSTKRAWVYACFRKRFHYSAQLSKLLTAICTYNGSVPVGSPLSSTLINIVFDPMWRQVEKICKNSDQNPTVWVDDIVVSGAEAEKLIQPIKNLINKRGLKIGWKKLKIMRANRAAQDSQEVTGCTVTNKLGVPPKKRQEYAKNIKAGLIDLRAQVVSGGQIAYTKFVNQSQGRQLTKLSRARK